MRSKQTLCAPRLGCFRPAERGEHDTCGPVLLAKPTYKSGISDTWRTSIIRNINSENFHFRDGDEGKVQGPAEKCIWESWKIFLNFFWLRNNNFLAAPLVDNRLFSRGLDANGRFDNRSLDRSFFWQRLL